ncbi:MAG: carboxymuconolactone decarboxylase family protein [Rhodospirillales bacterium]
MVDATRLDKSVTQLSDKPQHFIWIGHGSIQPPWRSCRITKSPNGGSLKCDLRLPSLNEIAITGNTKMAFIVHNHDTASAPSRDILDRAELKFGFIPNLMGVMAESPATLKAYFALAGLFDETSLTPTERQIVLLTVSYENGCGYCMAAHSVIARMQKVPENVIKSIRKGRPLEDHRWEALRHFTKSVIDQRGFASKETIDSFLQAGYRKENILEVIFGISFKTLSNYTNHITETPLDDAFDTDKWTKAG